MKLNLCQPGGGASCGACCGLYNFRDHARETVAAQLRSHTRVLAQTPRTAEAYSAAARALKTAQPAPAFADVRVCPLLGFLDPDEARVGCLAHPLQTFGTDLRDCGVYKAEICESFECPSYLWLSADEAALIREACPDWYLYGLVITDVDFVRAIFRLLAARVGEEVKASRLIGDPAAVAALARVFALKGSGADRDGIFGRFAPEADGQPGLRTLDYRALEASAAPEDDLVLLVGYAPKCADELESVRALIRKVIGALAEAVVAKQH